MQFLIYNGAFDIICHHTGIVNMLDNFSTWSGADSFNATKASPYKVDGQTKGYLTKLDNLRLMVVRNAQHAAPIDQPEMAFQMFNEFISGQIGQMAAEP